MHYFRYEMKDLEKYSASLLPKNAVKVESLHAVFSLVAVYKVAGLAEAANNFLTANWKVLKMTGVLKRLMADYPDLFLKAMGDYITSHK